MNRPVWAIVGALALAALAFALGRSSGSAAPPFAAPQAASASTSTAPSGAGDAASPSATSAQRAPAIASGATPAPVAAANIAAPLPPPDVPLADVLPELERRARAGDANASCRIGLELHRCRRRALARPNERLQTDWFARQPSDTPEQKKMLEHQIQLAAKARAAGERDDAVCAGIDAGTTNAAFDWILHAAERGNAAARLQMLQELPLDPQRFVVDADRLIAYREAAPRLAAAAVADGDPRILRTLAFAHYVAPPDAQRVYAPPGLRHLVPADNRRALAYWILARRYAPFPQEQQVAARRAQIQPGYVDPETVVRAELGPEGVAAAEALAAEIEREHYAATTPMPPGLGQPAIPEQCGDP